jgi:hypothetical protein
MPNGATVVLIKEQNGVDYSLFIGGSRKSDYKTGQLGL